MFKNQLQELAQRSCFNLPSYACIREGPDHAPRFKASVNFNGEIFESLTYSPTLRQAEHAAAEVALHTLSARGPSRSLTARVLDETGVYKNLLQETAHKAGLNLPVYTTVRSGPGHAPIFTCTVNLAGMNFTGEPTKTKKQAEKNAAIAAWSALKKLLNLDSLANKEHDSIEDRDEAAVMSRVLSSLKLKDESKQFRRRDNYNYKQGKRRSMVGIGSPSSGNSLLQQRRLIDLLMDSMSTSQKQNKFVSLFPPPPSRTTSKILPPPTSSRFNQPIQIQGKSEVKLPPPPPPEEIVDFINKSIEKEGSSSRNLVSSSNNVYGASGSYRPVPVSCSSGKLNGCMPESGSGTRTEARQLISRVLGSSKSNPAQMTTPPPPPTTSVTNTMVRNMYSGGFNPADHKIAPAVTIRSVIPVCAAPNRPLQSTTADIPIPSSMSLQTKSPNSDQLNSELMNLQL